MNNVHNTNILFFMCVEFRSDSLDVRQHRHKNEHPQTVYTNSTMESVHLFWSNTENHCKEIEMVVNTSPMPPTQQKNIIRQSK